jgi:hypothetical protein
MKKIAVDSARECLTRARTAYDSMKAANNFGSMEAAWTDFLLMSNRVYVRLEQGAKGNGTSFGWFGKKKHERRTDKLLSYVKNARDADEHGLDRITHRDPGGVGVNFPEGTTVKRGMVGGGRIEFELDEPRPVEIKFVGPSVKLIEVTNYGDKYGPPDSNPLIVAEAFLNHLEALIGEAETLV